jgi:hypothetical protein
MIGFALPGWIERLLGVSPAEVGQGTQWSWDFSPRLAPWLHVLLASGAVALIVWLYLRECGTHRWPVAVRLAVVRLAAVLVAWGMFHEVALVPRRTELQHLVLLLDDSESMNWVDDYRDARTRDAVQRRINALGELDQRQPSRWNLARAILLSDDARLLRALAARYRLRVYLVSENARLLPADVEALRADLLQRAAQGRDTRLGQCAQQVLNDLRGARPAAMIVVSDGINTAGPTLRDLADEMAQRDEAAARRLREARDALEATRRLMSGASPTAKPALAEQLVRQQELYRQAQADYERLRAVPLFALGLGSRLPAANVELVHVRADEAVFVGDVLQLDVRLSATGLSGKTVRLVLREKGHSEPLAEMLVELGEDGRPLDAALRYRPQREGTLELEITAEPLPEEGNRTADNRRTHVVQVRKLQLRVLLAASGPSYEFRFLKNMLLREPTIELHTVQQGTDPQRYPAIDKTALPVFPLGRDELFRYDVLVLVDLDPAFVGRTAQQHISDFVLQRGGGVVFVAGPRFLPAAYRGTPLEALLPVDASAVHVPRDAAALRTGFVPQLTPLGLSNPALHLGDTPEQTQSVWHKLPPLYWLLEVERLKPGVQVLAEHPLRRNSQGARLPVICAAYAGAGKVVFHATDETYRWRYRDDRELWFSRYWVQTIRSLSRARLADEAGPVQLRADRQRYIQGDDVRLLVRFFDERQAPADDQGVVVLVQGNAGQTRLVLRRSAAQRGLFEATLPAVDVGSYEAWIVQPPVAAAAGKIAFEVELPHRERLRTQLDAVHLDDAARRVGGRYYDVSQLDSLRDALLAALPAPRHVEVEALRPVPLWNHPAVLTLLLLLLTAEWLARKLRSMP